MAGGSLSPLLDLAPVHSLDLSPPCKWYHLSSGDESSGDLKSGPGEIFPSEEDTDSTCEGAIYHSEESLDTFIVKKTPAGKVMTNNEDHPKLQRIGCLLIGKCCFKLGKKCTKGLSC